MIPLYFMPYNFVYHTYTTRPMSKVLHPHSYCRHHVKITPEAYPRQSNSFPLTWDQLWKHQDLLSSKIISTFKTSAIDTSTFKHQHTQITLKATDSQISNNCSPNSSLPQCDIIIVHKKFCIYFQHLLTYSPIWITLSQQIELTINTSRTQEIHSTSNYETQNLALKPDVVPTTIRTQPRWNFWQKDHATRA